MHARSNATEITTSSPKTSWNHVFQFILWSSLAIQQRRICIFGWRRGGWWWWDALLSHKVVVVWMLLEIVKLLLQSKPGEKAKVEEDIWCWFDEKLQDWVKNVTLFYFLNSHSRYCTCFFGRPSQVWVPRVIAHSVVGLECRGALSQLLFLNTIDPASWKAKKTKKTIHIIIFLTASIKNQGLGQLPIYFSRSPGRQARPLFCWSALASLADCCKPTAEED